MKRSRRGAVGLALVLAVASLAVAQSPGGAVTRPGGKLVPSTGALFGTYIRPASSWSRDDVKAVVTNRERDMGRKYDVTNWYYRFDEAFPNWQATWNAENGRETIVSWKPTYSSTINSGGADSVIKARADAVKAFGKPIFIRYAWEMDSPHINGQYAGSPSSFIAAWKRIVNTFRSRGATNAVFVWCPTSWGFVTGRAQPYYPGDAYVDWVCSDGYNWYKSASQPNAPYRTLKEIYAPSYKFAMDHNKPMMIGEVGMVESSSGLKAKWIAESQSTLKNSMPGVAAFVWFDVKHGEDDWRTNSSTSSYSAYKTMARDPYFIH